jgi:hypothetical protein
VRPGPLLERPCRMKTMMTWRPVPEWPEREQPERQQPEQEPESGPPEREQPVPERQQQARQVPERERLEQEQPEQEQPEQEQPEQEQPEQARSQQAQQVQAPAQRPVWVLARALQAQAVGQESSPWPAPRLAPEVALRPAQGSPAAARTSRSYRSAAPREPRQDRLRNGAMAQPAQLVRGQLARRREHLAQPVAARFRGRVFFS